MSVLFTLTFYTKSRNKLSDIFFCKVERRQNNLIGYRYEQIAALLENKIKSRV